MVNSCVTHRIFRTVKFEILVLWNYSVCVQLLEPCDLCFLQSLSRREIFSCISSLYDN